MDNTEDKPKSKELSSTEQLALIAEQKSAIENIIKITLAISRLQSGLENILLLGKPSSQISKSYLEKFDAVHASIGHLPSDKLEQSLVLIEAHINANLSNMMQIVEKGGQAISDETGSISIDDIHNNIHTLLQDFQRKSQTAVVLRLILRERGLRATEIELSVPPETIIAHISALNAREKICRKRIHSEITLMGKYVERVIAIKDIPDAVRDEMLSVREALQHNLEHLIEGKPIDELPVFFEIVEMGTEEDHEKPFAPTSLPEKAPSAPKTERPSEQAEPQDKIPRSFLSRFIEWCTTPPSVRWQDISKTQQDKK